MICGEATFSLEEIKGFLTEAGFREGSAPYAYERQRRYVPVEGQPGYFSEAPTWSGGIKTTYTLEEAEYALKLVGVQRGGQDFVTTLDRNFVYNEVRGVFEPRLNPRKQSFAEHPAVCGSRGGVSPPAGERVLIDQDGGMAVAST